MVRHEEACRYSLEGKWCSFSHHSHFGKPSKSVLNTLIHDRKVKNACVTHGYVFINARLPSGTLPSGMITTQYKFTPSRCRHNHISVKFARVQDAAFLLTSCQLKETNNTWSSIMRVTER